MGHAGFITPFISHHDLSVFYIYSLWEGGFPYDLSKTAMGGIFTDE